MCESIASSAVNFASLKVTESGVGFPVDVFGTVIARDGVDYRCVYLFRREVDDSQTIISPVCIHRFVPLPPPPSHLLLNC